MPDNGKSAFEEHNHHDRLDDMMNPPPRGTVSQQRQRATVQFDLQSEPVLPEWRDVIRVAVQPQDPFAHNPVMRIIPSKEIRRGIFNDRFRMRDTRKVVAQPDERGDYIFPRDSAEFDQINVIYYATHTLRMVEQYAGRAIPWSFGPGQLILDPCVNTTQANAYYIEAEQFIGFFNVRFNGHEVHAAHSSDVIAHEVGHAVLDGMRDLLNVSLSFGPEVFHESFCDMMAILVALHDNGLIDHLTQLNNGDLRIKNYLSALAEEIASTRRAGAGGSDTDHVFYLRNALNDFCALPFDELPYIPDNRTTQLGREAHNYSRVYTGALYSILVALYEQNQKSWPKGVALALARDVVGELLVRSVELGPIGECSLEDFAWAMLVADRLFLGGKYKDVLTEEFTRRKLLTPSQAIRAVKKPRLPKVTLPAALNDADSAQEFLEHNRVALGLPKDMEFYTQLGYRDRLGYRFITYFTPETLVLNGKEFDKYQGRPVQIFGGVVLVFDPQGKLCHLLHRPVTEEDRRQMRVQIADMIKARHLTFAFADGDGEPLERRAIVTFGTDRILDQKLITSILPDFQPLGRGGDLPTEASPPADVVRVSMQISDQPDILDYLHSWADKISAVGKTAKKSKKR